MGNRKQSKQSDGLNEHFVMYCMVEISNLSNFSDLETGYCSQGPRGCKHDLTIDYGSDKVKPLR